MIDEGYDTQANRLVVPGLGGLYGALAPFAYAAIRVLVSLIILPGGITKLFHGEIGRIAAGSIHAMGFPFPYAWAWAVAILEFFGPILLAVGLFTRPVAFALTVELLVITVGIMIKRGPFWPTGGVEVALLLCMVAFAFVIGGGGRYSLDRMIGREF